MDDTINFWLPLDLSKSTDDGERRICGIISTEDVDLDGEVIREQLANYSPILSTSKSNIAEALADRIDWDRFSTRAGFLKWEHGSEPGNIIGIPERIEKGVVYHDPLTDAAKSGTAIWGRLFGPDAGIQKANEAWALIQAIRKSGFKRPLGYSIEGAYLPRPDLGKSERACLVTNVVLTTKPVNSATWATDLAKALVAGPPGVTDVAQLSGGAALRRQSLNDKIAVTHQGATPMAKCGHMNERGKLKDKQAAYEHARKCLGKSQVIATAVVTYLYPKSA